MKPGFVLVEILVAVALGSLIGVAVFTSFFQANRAYQMADRIIDIDSKLCIVQHQLERDFSGAFIPFVFEKKEKSAAAKAMADRSDRPGRPEKEISEVPLKDAFLSRVEGGNVTLFSFVTSNPLRVYGKEIPRIARVVYQLIPEEQKKGAKKSYALFRKEYKDISFKESKEKASRGLKLADGIKNMSIEYEVRVASQKEEEKEQEFKYETAKVWSEEQIKKFKRNIPHFVTTTISFWDRAKKRSRQFTLKTVIVADEAQPKEKKKEPQKNNGKPGKANDGKVAGKGS